jgi:RNase P/RNase MRP subunit p30
MNFELNMPCPNRDVQRMSIDRAIRLGWDGVVLTQTVYSSAKIPQPLEPTELNDECRSIVERNYGLCVLGSYPPFPQFTRLNLETEKVDDLKTLIRNSGSIRHSIISVTPLSEAVFRFACQCSDKDIDIISINPSRFDAKKKWKDAKGAVSKGIVIEFHYDDFLDYKKRQSLISAVQSAAFVLRARNILLSYGSQDTEIMRSPSDVLNIANLLAINNPHKLTNEIAKKVLAKGLARQTHVGITRELPIIIKDADDESDSSDLEIVIKTN